MQQALLQGIPNKDNENSATPTDLLAWSFAVKPLLIQLDIG